MSLLLLLAGCARSPEAVPAPVIQPARVELVAPVEKALRKTVAQPGTVQADEMVALHPKLAGYVKSVLADIGQEVEAGQVLSELSMPELVEEAKEKRARTAQAAAQVVQAERALDAAKALGDEASAAVAKADAMRERWTTEDKRVRGLIGRGVIDEQTRDEARSQLKASKAAWDEARARQASVGVAVVKAEADILVAKANQAVATAEEGRVAALIGYATIRAPFAGMVVRRDVNLGDLVRPGGRSPLFGVARIDPVRVVVHVPETDAVLATMGTTVTLAIQALRGKPIQATISRTSWALSHPARTLRVELDVPNPDKRLRPGMYAYAHFTSPLPKAWTLPAGAVARLGDLVVVYRVEDGKAVQTPVETGHAEGGRVQVLRWLKSATPPVWVPFDGSERLVARVTGLFDGQPVEAATK